MVTWLHSYMGHEIYTLYVEHGHMATWSHGTWALNFIKHAPWRLGDVPNGRLSGVPNEWATQWCSEWATRCSFPLLVFARCNTPLFTTNRYISCRAKMRWWCWPVGSPRTSRVREHPREHQQGVARQAPHIVRLAGPAA